MTITCTFNIIINNHTGIITVEDFLFTEDKHKSSSYPDNESIEKVSH